MKKFRLFLALGSLVTSLFSFSSCKKSYNCCTNSYGYKECTTVTKTSHETNKHFNDRISYYEANGYTCK